MTRDQVTDRLTLGLGVLYVLAGIGETIRAVWTGDGLVVPLVAIAVIVLTLRRTTAAAEA